jgi:hypothetical protein
MGTLLIVPLSLGTTLLVVQVAGFKVGVCSNKNPLDGGGDHAPETAINGEATAAHVHTGVQLAVVE